MELEILLIAVLVAGITGIALNGFVDVIDRRAAQRINAAEEPARKLSDRAEERVGGALERLVPGYVRRIRSDLYWATFADSRLQNRSAAAVFGRQVLLTVGVGLAGYLALGSTIALAGGLFIGWTLASTDLHGKAETIRLRIAQELPEFVQLMAAESASGAGLAEVLQRAASGASTTAAWLRSVLNLGAGKSLFSENGQAGFLLTAAQESGHAGLISLAIQLGFVGRGVQVQSLLKSLAQTFADEFIAQAETRAEKLGSNLGVMAAIFYFMPFVITVLVVVGVPLINTIAGA
jgi:Flp pilus assembly protein TadB